ncbi:MAG: hypothetical protein HYS98_07575 [Deltaproteobacteria bacterium]|nr:hypothetical protein [Deltaproteobacteria bacterium]
MKNWIFIILVGMSFVGCGGMNKDAEQVPIRTSNLRRGQSPSIAQGSAVQAPASLINSTGDIRRFGELTITNEAAFHQSFGAEASTQGVVLEVSFTALASGQIQNGRGALSIYFKKGEAEVYVYDFARPQGTVNQNDMNLRYFDAQGAIAIQVNQVSLEGTGGEFVSLGYVDEWISQNIN